VEFEHQKINDECTVFVDIMKLAADPSTAKISSMAKMATNCRKFEQQQYFEPYILLNQGFNTVRTNFNHPTWRITIYNNNPFYSQPMIQFNGDSTVLYFHTMPNYNGKFCSEIVFEPTINFSRIDKADVIINSDVNSEVSIIADSWNVIRFGYTMAGLAFTN
jgi:hypothetical protein